MDTNEGLHTEGRRLLVVALKEPGRSQVWLAEKLDIAQSSVSLWARGHSRPSEHLRLMIAELLDIPVEAWRTEEEAAQLDAFRAARSVPTPPEAA